MADQVDFTVKLIGKNPGMDKLEKSLNRVLGATRKFVGGTKRAEKATGRFRDATGKLREANGRFVQGQGKGGGIFGGALSILGGNLMTAAVNKTLDLAKAVGVAGSEFVTFGQNSRLAFSNLAKHGADPEKLFGHARALAVRFGLDVMDTTKQYQKFLALQFDPKQADRMIRMGADLQALGNSAEDVQGVFMALGQIKGKGRLQAEELLQLSERGVSSALVQEEIGKLMGGKSTAQVQKAMQAGAVAADVGLQAIENAINRKLGQSQVGESGAKFADKTISGMLGRFEALGQDTGLKVMDRVAAPITKVLGETLTKLVTFLESSKGKDLIDKLAVSMERMAKAAAEMGGDLMKKFIEADWKAIGEDILNIANGLIAAAKAGTELGKALGIIGSSDKAGDKATEAAAGPPKRTEDRRSVAAYAAGGAAVGAVAGSVIPGAGTVAGAAVGGLVGAGMAALGNVGTDLGNAFADGLLGPSVQERAYDAGHILGEQTDAGARDALGIHSPSRVAMDAGMQVAAGMALGIRRGQRSIDSANLAMADGFALGPKMSGLSLAAQDGGGGRAINVTVNTEVNGGGKEGAELARLVAKETRREVEAVLRQLAHEV